MANTTGYMGFKQIGFLPGASPDYQLQALTVTNANATAIYRGDPVIFASGFIQRAENGSTNVHGIFDGCTYVDSSGLTHFQSYCPTSQTATCYVISAPNAMFVVQTNGTAITTASINKNVGFVVGTGQTTGGQFSLYTVSNDNVTTNNAMPFRIVNLWSTFQPSANGSDNSSNNNMVVVCFNSQDFKAGVTGV